MASNRGNNRTRRTAKLEPTQDGKLVNRSWNNRKGEFKPRTAPAPEPRKRPHEVARVLPDTARRTVTGVFSVNGGNHGGICDGCGKELSYWIHFKRCDACLTGARPAPRRKAAL